MRNGARILIDAWREMSLKGPVYVLPGEECLTRITNHAITNLRGYGDFVESQFLEDLGANRLHLNLVPVPYVGDLMNASLIILMANPGVDPDDYYFEEKFDEYKEALGINLRQKGLEYPFVCLDPRFACTGGGRYWVSKLKCALSEWRRQTGHSYRQALKHVASKIAVLQLVPYHSAEFNLPRWLERKRSVELAKDCARDLNGNPRFVIVTRAVRKWQLPENDCTVNYSPSASRNASLSCSSEGWEVLLKGLCLDPVKQCPCPH